MLGLLTTILGGWVGGGLVLDYARLKLTQPSLAGAGAELGNICHRRFPVKERIFLVTGEKIPCVTIHFSRELKNISCHRK